MDKKAPFPWLFHVPSLLIALVAGVSFWWRYESRREHRFDPLIREAARRSGLDPAVLRKNVTSPNGTTAAALAVLMAEDGLQPLLTRAVQAAARRSRELSG